MELHTSLLGVNLLLFIAGFIVLIKGSDLFIDAAAAVARSQGISELAIGLTLVSIGTSLPELASSLYAAACGECEFVIGNVVGSISTNITLILGAGVVLGKGLSFSPALLKRDSLLMNGIFILTAILALCFTVDGDAGAPVTGVNRFSGFLLLAMAVLYCAYLLKHPDELSEEAAESTQEHVKPDDATPLWLNLGMVLFGAVMVTLGSKLLVDNVVWAAEQLRINTMVISATIVAFGTSLPELAVTVAGVRKQHHDMAVGNIIGSCIFNVLLIIGGSALVHPLEIATPAAWANIAIMVACGLVLSLLMKLGKTRLTVPAGWALLLVYAGFLCYNLLAALR